MQIPHDIVPQPAWQEVVAAAAAAEESVETLARLMEHNTLARNARSMVRHTSLTRSLLGAAEMFARGDRGGGRG